MILSEILALFRQWNEWVVIWSFVQQMHVFTTWTWHFSRLFRHVPCSTRKEGLKGEVGIADFSKNFLIFLNRNIRACFLWFQTFSDFEEAGLSILYLVSFSASVWAWKFHSQNNSAVSENKKRTSIELCLLKKKLEKAQGSYDGESKEMGRSTELAIVYSKESKWKSEYERNKYAQRQRTGSKLSARMLIK